MLTLLSGRFGVAIAALAGLWSWDVILFAHTRSWSAWLPVGLGVIYAVWLARQRRSSGGRIDRFSAVALALALGLVALLHVSFVRAAGDGREYFVQLHSFVLDWDVDFTNEVHNFGAVTPALFPIGSAILWIPFYVAAHLWILLLQAVGVAANPDGYGPPYQMAIGLGTVVYSLAGMALAYRVARDFFSPAIALASIVAVVSGSFLIWYLTIDPSWSHGTSMFAVTLFLYVWHTSRGTRPPAQWMLLGAAAGLMALVRWQNAMFVLVPAIEVVVSAARRIRAGELARIVPLTRSVVYAAMAGLVVFLPQMYVWKRHNGGWLTPPHGQAGQMWWNDSLVADVLFSSNHGLFAWHPLLYVATLGMLLFARRDWKFAGLLAICFLVQAYLIGAVSTWWGGSSFGGRRFDGMTLMFVLGLGSVIQAAFRRPVIVVAGAGATFVLGNALLIAGVKRGELPVGDGVTVTQFAASAARRIGNPFSFPANAWFAWRHGATLGDYDRLSRQLYSNIRIDFGTPGDDEFLTRGWSGRENDSEGSFRWSDGPASGVAVSLLGARVLEGESRPGVPNYRLLFRAAPFEVAERGPQRLIIEINGANVAEFDMASGYQTYTVSVAGGRLGRGLNTLRFRYGYAISPRAAGVGGDTRMLGARFSWLTFTQDAPH